MRVHFVLPTDGTVPVGGCPVVYEYALAWRVGMKSITHPFCLQRPAKFEHPDALAPVAHLHQALGFAAFHAQTCSSWTSCEAAVCSVAASVVYAGF